MKIFRMIGILGLVLSSFKVEARTMATGMPAGKYTVSAFDKARNVLYLGETGTTVAQKVVRVAADASGQLVATVLGTTTEFPAASPILKLDVDEDGNLLVSNGTASFYILPKAYQNTTSVISSPAAADNADSTVNASFKEVCFCSKNELGQMQIFGAIPTAGHTNFASFNGVLRLYTFDGASIVDTTLKLNLTNSWFGNSGGFSDTVMHWDADLQRLYVGAKGILTSTASGNCFLKVVRIDATNALLASAFSPVGAAGVLNQNPIGIYGSLNNYSINFVKTIKSQANGKKYLVAQINHDDSAANSAASLSIYAFPVADAATAAVDVIGCAADVNPADGNIDRANIASATARTYARIETIDSAGVDLLDSASFDTRALVGGNYTPNPLGTSAQSVKHLSVFGDSVIATSLNDTANYKAFLSGSYSSSPIYDLSGEIRGWTPWARVFAGNATTDNFIHALHIAEDGLGYFVAGAKNSSSVNVAGKVDFATSSLSTSMHSFSDKVNADSGEVRPWFARSFPLTYNGSSLFGTAGIGNVDLTILGSRDKVFLALTGSSNEAVYLSADTITDSHFKSFVCSGEILCAEVARIGAPVTSPGTSYPTKHGYLFVGTSAGLFVLKNIDGTGFNAQDLAPNGTSSLLNFGTALAGMEFASVDGIYGAVHALHSTGKYLYVMGKDFVKRIRLHCNDNSIHGGTLVAYDVDPAMFAPGAIIREVSESVDLSNTDPSTATAEAYPVENLVVQTVKTAGDGEYFVDMVGFPNTATIFLASITPNGRTNIFTLFGDDPVVSRTELTGGGQIGVLKDSAPYQVNGFVRKMALRHINYQNMLLNDASSAPGYIESDTNGFFYDNTGKTPNVIGTDWRSLGNLFLFMGDLSTRQTELKIFQIRGSLKKVEIPNGATPTPANDIFYTTEMDYDFNATALGTNARRGLVEVTTAKSIIPMLFLPNAVDLVMTPFLYGSAFANRAPVQILGSATFANPKLTPSENNLLAEVQHIFSVARTASGAMLVMTDQGVFVFE